MLENIMKIEFKYMGIDQVAVFNLDKISEVEVKEFIDKRYPCDYDPRILFTSTDQWNTLFS